MIEQVLCDMDGVLADFVSGAAKAHHRESPYLYPKNYGTFDIEKLWDISAQEFWAPIDAMGQDFWLGLEKTPEADELVALLTERVGVESIAILTAPSDDPGCVPGKRAWIRKHYPQFSKQIIYTSAKGFLAAPTKLLIDDRDRNIDEFRRDGGQAILLPRLWNRLYYGLVTQNPVQPLDWIRAHLAYLNFQISVLTTNTIQEPLTQGSTR